MVRPANLRLLFNLILNPTIPDPSLDDQRPHFAGRIRSRNIGCKHPVYDSESKGEVFKIRDVSINW